MSDDRGEADCVEVCDEKQEVYARLQALGQGIDRVNDAGDLETLEREIRGCTNRLAALVLQEQIQALVDSSEQQEKEQELIRSWPGRMRSDGYETVRIRTVGGCWIHPSTVLPSRLSSSEWKKA